MDTTTTKMAEFLKTGDEGILNSFESEVHGEAVDSADHDLEEEVPELEATEEPQEALEEPEAETSEYEASEASDETTEEETPSSIHQINYTDHKGRKTAEVDFSDTDTVKKLISRAYGSQKWKVGMDKAVAESKAKDAEMTQVKEAYAGLEEAWGEGGAEGIKNVIARLAGDDQALDILLDERQAERERLAAMDPNTRMKWEHEQERIKERASYDRQIKAIQAEREAASSSKEEADLARTRQLAQSAYSKYNFEGKLGDEDAEETFSNIVWEKSFDLLEQKGIEDPTSAQLNKAFELTYNKIAKTVTKQVDKQVNKTIEKKKVDAEKSVANLAKSKMTKKGSSFGERLKDSPVDLMKDILAGKIK